MPTITLLMEVTEYEKNALLARVMDRAGPIPSDGQNYDPGENAPDNLTPPALDTKGLPWDERIHAKSKALNADGSWRSRRNVEDAIISQVEAELRARLAAGVVPVAAPPVQEVIPPAVVPAAAPPAMPGGLPGMPAIPAMPPIVVPPADVPVSLDAVIAKFSEVMGNGKLPAENVGAIYTAAGVTSTDELTTNETLRKNLMAELVKLG